MKTRFRDSWLGVTRVVSLVVIAVVLLVGCDDPPVANRLQQTLGGDPDAGFLRATVARPFSFPKDHGAHTEFQTEWWYFTGHLVTALERGTAQRRFGFQLTFFRQALAPDNRPPGDNSWSANQLYLAHFAISAPDNDPGSGQFHHAQRLARGSAGQAGAATNHMAVQVEDWKVDWVNNQIELSAQSDGWSIELQLDPVSPVIAHGDRGLSIKGAGTGNASYYYSIPELTSRGTLKVSGKSYAVSGDSWLDREWSTSVLGPNQAGWDWFSLNLRQGRYLMLFQLRDGNGNPDQFSAGTLVDGDKIIPLKAEDFRLTASNLWRSPHSGARYPLNWQIGLPAHGLELSVSALLNDQEVNQTFRYWEGAIRASGQWREESIKAQGYLEMTGYDAER